MQKKKKKKKEVRHAPYVFFSDPVLILKVNEVFRTKKPRETSTKKRFSAKVCENPKFSLPQAKEVQV